MKLITRTIQVLAFAGIAFPMAPALAEQPPGFYLGVGIGESDADLSAGELDGIIRDAFASQGVSILSRNSSIDTKDSSLYVFAGYRILQWVSAEVGYIDLGRIQHNFDGRIFVPGSGTQSMTSVTTFDNRGLVANALGTLPLGNYFDIHGRLGFFFIDTDLAVTINANNRSVTETDSTTSFAIQAGLGAAVHLGNHFSISADWVHYLDVGNGDDGDEDEDDGGYDNGFDVDVINISAIVRF